MNQFTQHILGEEKVERKETRFRPLPRDDDDGYLEPARLNFNRAMQNRRNNDDEYD